MNENNFYASKHAYNYVPRSLRRNSSSTIHPIPLYANQSSIFFLNIPNENTQWDNNKSFNQLDRSYLDDRIRYENNHSRRSFLEEKPVSPTENIFIEDQSINQLQTTQNYDQETIKTDSKKSYWEKDSIKCTRLCIAMTISIIISILLIVGLVLFFILYYIVFGGK